MARPKTEFRNEVKTRVSDHVYDGLKQYIAINRCASEARAISDLLEVALYGSVGSVPTDLVERLYGIGQLGTKTPA